MTAMDAATAGTTASCGKASSGSGFYRLAAAMLCEKAETQIIVRYSRTFNEPTLDEGKLQLQLGVISAVAQYSGSRPEAAGAVYIRRELNWTCRLRTTHPEVRCWEEWPCKI
jgi:hypothetical protein